MVIWRAHRSGIQVLRRGSTPPAARPALRGWALFGAHRPGMRPKTAVPPTTACETLHAPADLWGSRSRPDRHRIHAGTAVTRFCGARRHPDPAGEARLPYQSGGACFAIVGPLTARPALRGTGRDRHGPPFAATARPSRHGPRPRLGAMAPERVLGRGDELARIERFITGFPQGPHALVIAGEAGIGKTVLWAEAERLARSRDGLTVLTARHRGGGQPRLRRPDRPARTDRSRRTPDPAATPGRGARGRAPARSVR
jgi:hypothetical protein